jgi:hypothetical protein
MATTSDISGNIIKQTVKRALEEALIEKSFKEKTNESQNKLWDKDKLILIFYIGIGCLSQQKAYDILQNISNEIDDMFDESVKPIIMPVRDGGDIRVEPIYMQTITNNEDNNRLTETINKLEQAVKNLYDTQIA